MADQPIALEQLTRPQLQHICKINNIKANLKTDALLKQLEDLGSKLHRYSGDHLPTVPHDPFDAVDDDSGPGSSAPPVPVYIPPVSAIPRRTRSHQAASDTEPELSEPPAQRQVSFSARLPSTRKTTRSRGVSYAIAADPPLPEIMESEKENEKEPVRTRAKDTQKRLGVGRPRAAGGAGPRQVTRAPTSRIATRRVTVQVDGESFVPGVTPQGSEIHDEGNDTDVPIAGPSRRPGPARPSTTRLADLEAQVSKLLATNATVMSKLSSLEKTSISTRDDVNTQRERVDESKRNVLELRRELAGADGMSAAGRIAEGEERISVLELTDERMNARVENLERRLEEEMERRVLAEARVEKLEELLSEVMTRFTGQIELISPKAAPQEPPDAPPSTLGKRTREQELEATPSSDMSFSFFDPPQSALSKRARYDSPRLRPSPKTPPPTRPSSKAAEMPEIGHTGGADRQPSGIKPGSSNIFTLPPPTAKPPRQAPTSPTLDSPRRGAGRAAKIRGNERLPAVSIMDTLADDNEFPSYGIPPSPALPIGYGAGPGQREAPSPFSFADHSIQAYLLPPFAPYPMARTLSASNPALYPPLAVPATPEPRDEMEREEKRVRDMARARERQLREDGPPPSPGKRTMYGSEMERLEGRFGDYTRWD